MAVSKSPERDRSYLVFQAATSRSWLPAGELPELDELRREHLRLLDERNAATERVRVATERFEREDEARNEAFERQLAGETVRIPKTTPDAERERILEPLRAQSRIVSTALDEHVGRILDTAAESAGEWLAEIEDQERDARAEIERAEATLRAARVRLHERDGLKSWICRTAGPPHHRWGSLASRMVEHGALQGGTPPEPDPERLLLRSRDSAWPQPDEQPSPDEDEGAQEPAPVSDPTREDTSVMDVAELREWIERERPSGPQMLAAAGGNPEVAARLIEAEQGIAGREPRSGTIAALEEIAGDADEDEED
jgi:hypothetical protein